MFYKLILRYPIINTYLNILFADKSTGNFLGISDKHGKQKQMWKNPHSEPDGPVGNTD